MLHCIRDDSYRKSSITPVAFEGEQGLHPFNNSASKPPIQRKVG